MGSPIVPAGAALQAFRPPQTSAVDSLIWFWLQCRRPRMMPRSRCRLAILSVASLLACPHSRAAKPPDDATIIRNIDAAVRARNNHVLSYTVIEHYAVYHHNEQSPPVAQMTVKTLYQKASGKTYSILAQSGSSIVRKLVLDRLLENEKEINNPAEIEEWWLTSANYEMKVQPGGPQPMDGHECYAVSMTPRRSAPNLLRGTMWVDARDFYTVRIEGVSSKSPSIFTGPTQMMRQYTLVDGYEQATHARAVSNSMFFGRAIITIDYSNYQVQLAPDR
jgi:hypothetical protein